MWLGPLQPIYPPDSNPPSKDSLAFASIFARFPKAKVAKPALERRAAFERLGALQSVHPSAQFLAPIHVPLLTSPELKGQRTHVTVHPIRPSITVHGKVIIYLHAGAYISGSINSHRGFVSQLAEQTHRLTYFVDYWYATHECLFLSIMSSVKRGLQAIKERMPFVAISSPLATFQSPLSHNACVN